MASSQAKITALQNTAVAASSVMAKAFAVLTPVLTVGAFVMFTKRAMGAIDNIGKLSDRLDVATEDLIAFHHAAETTGSSTGAVDTALRFMNRAIGEAKMGMGESTRVFKKWNLEAKDMAVRSTGDNFRMLADKIAAIPTASDRAVVAMHVFGRGGMEIVNMLSLGKEGLEKMKEETIKLGMSFDRVDAAKVEAANDAITRLKGLFTGMFQQIAIQLAPIIEAIVDKITEFGTKGQRSSNLVSDGFKRLIEVFAWAADAIEWMSMGIKGFEYVAVKAVEYIANTFNYLLTIFESVYNTLVEDLGGSELGMQPMRWTRELDKFIEHAQKTAGRISKELSDAFLAPSYSQRIEEFLDDVAKKADDARKKMVELAEEKAKLIQEYADAQAFEGLIEKIDEVKKKYAEQIEYFGASAREIEFGKLAMIEVPPGYESAYAKELLAIIDLMEQLDMLEEKHREEQEAQAKYNQLIEEGEQVFEQTRTPLESYFSELEKLHELLIIGAISWDTYQRAVEAAEKKLDKVGPQDVGKFMTIRTDLIDVAGLSMTTEFDPVVDRLDRQWEEAKKQTGFQRRLVEMRGLN